MSQEAADKDFIRIWREEGGSPSRVAKLFHVSPRAVQYRRAGVENRTGIQLSSTNQMPGRGRGDADGLPEARRAYQPWIEIEGFTGSAVIFNDVHRWPGPPSVAESALLTVCPEIKPRLVLGNGDLLDGARISRHPRGGWEYRPELDAELEAVKAMLAEISMAAPGARRIRTVGNHCARFDTWLANRAAEMEGLLGTRLSDHLPGWEEALAVRINGHTVIKHRWHGGVHAAWNNVMKSGVNIITGHTHWLEVKPYTDYTGTRFGCQGGCLADPEGPQFAYGEENPSQARSGFLVLTFDDDGDLLHPEQCEVRYGTPYFRGKPVATEAVMHKPASPARRDAPSRIKPARRARRK